MDDVRARIRRPAEPCHELDRLLFCGRWTRGEIRRVAVRVCGRERRGDSIDRSRELGVDQEWRVEPGEDLHRGRELRFSDPTELGDARIDEKTFEPADAIFYEPCELALIARHDAAPKPDVDRALPFRCRALRGERFTRRRGWNRIERHVDERGHATDRCGGRRGREAFPLGATRFVQVHVRIDDARQDRELAVVDRVTRRVAPIGELGDHAIRDVNRRRLHTLGCHHAARSHDRSLHRARLYTPDCNRLRARNRSARSSTPRTRTDRGVAGESHARHMDPCEWTNIRFNGSICRTSHWLCSSQLRWGFPSGDKREHRELCRPPDALDTFELALVR